MQKIKKLSSAFLAALTIISVVPFKLKATGAENENNGTTVKFFVNEANDYIKEKINTFQSEYNINVRLIQITADNYYQELTARIADGDSPDIAFFNLNNINLFQPINKFSSFENCITEPFKFKNNIFAVSSPEFIGGRFIVYNRRFFSECNITTPNDYCKMGRWTSATFYKTLLDIKHSSNIIPLCSNDSLGDIFGENIANVLSLNNGRLEYNGFDSSYLKSHADMLKYGFIGKYDMAEFADEKAAMISIPISLGNNDLFEKLNNLDIDIVPLPNSYGYYNDPVVFDSGMWQSFAIPKNAQNADGAARLIEYLLNDSGQAYSKYIENKTVAEFIGKLKKFSCYKYNYSKSVFPEDYIAISSIDSSEQVETTLEEHKNSIDSRVNELNLLLDKLSYSPKCTINIDNLNISLGNVTESFSADKNSVVTISAKPNKGCCFIGWYENGLPISKEKDYSFTVNSDRNLTAKFSKGDINDDGEVNILDLIKLKRFFADPGNNVIPSECLDVSGNGIINSADLAALKKIILMQ